MDHDLQNLLPRFGVTELRAHQREAITALLPEGARVLLVAPTGGGKSLCYQLPAASLPGTALVLSPLIALMEDQVRALDARGIAATYLASTLPREENARRLAEVRRGALRVVYAAPERLSQPGFLEALIEAGPSLAAIDEAHCIVQWGHDFRPDYLRIGEALSRLRPPRIIACTATATAEARAEIVRCLGWEGAPVTLVLRGFARPNLHLAVRTVSGPRRAEEEVGSELAAALGSPAAPAGAGIVYTATRRAAEVLAARLGARGFDAAAYHAGLDAAARAEVSARFAERSLPVVVATNAFGMGIDRPDVRAVIHAQPSASIEAYYQEVGRAGRDGAPAHGVLLVSGADVLLRRRLCARGEGGLPADPSDAARAWERFRALLRYVDAATCRHDFILRHFGAEAESLGGCGHCDICLSARDTAALEADRDAVRRALAGVARARGAAPLGAVAAMLGGERSLRVTRAGLDRLSTFGVLGGRSAAEILAILRALLANGWIDLHGGDFPAPRLTPLGWQVIRGEIEVEIRLPAAPERAAAARRDNHSRTAGEDNHSRLGAGDNHSRAAPGADQPRLPFAPGEVDLRPAPNHAPAARLGDPPRAAPTDSHAPGAGAEEALFQALRAHRAELSRTRAVPPYVIATDRSLRAVAAARPRTAGELLRCHGMGPTRLRAFGEGILSVVRDYVSAEAAASPPAAPPARLADLAYARFWQEVRRAPAAQNT